jgi:hypothetical protein
MSGLILSLHFNDVHGTLWMSGRTFDSIHDHPTSAFLGFPSVHGCQADSQYDSNSTSLNPTFPLNILLPEKQDFLFYLNRPDLGGTFNST